MPPTPRLPPLYYVVGIGGHLNKVTTTDETLNVSPQCCVMGGGKKSFCPLEAHACYQFHQE